MNSSVHKSKDAKVVLPGILSEFRTALEEEIDAIKTSGQTSTLLYSGRRIESHGQEFWYRFNVEYAPNLPADTPCKLVIGKDHYDVTVISFEENSIIISTKTMLPDSIGKARLENGATVLMERLIKCIEDNIGNDNRVGKLMLPPDGGISSFNQIHSYDDLTLKDSNTSSQNKAIIAALSNDITYIWGPPGTGKTTVIGQIIDALFKHDRTVLVVSHTNTAVDGAIKKTDENYDPQDEDASYPILRLGTSKEKLPDRVELSHHVKILGKDLYAQKVSLEKQRDELQQRRYVITPLLAKSCWITNSNLTQINEVFAIIKQYSVNLNDLQRQCDSLNDSIQQEKTAHPEYAQYLVLSKKIKAKKAVFHSICEKIQQAKLSEESLLSQFQTAQDEVKKHEVYADLRVREAKFMSASFIQSELDKTRESIKTLEIESANLSSAAEKAQRTIAEYEKKNSVARFLSGKSAVKLAIDSLQSIDTRLLQTKDRLLTQRDLEKEYVDQLSSLRLLQEQIRAVVPSETPEHWRSEANRLQADLANVQKSLNSLSSEKDFLTDELHILEQQQQQAKGHFDYIKELGNKLLAIQEHYRNVKAASDRENNRCSELLEKECAYCATFNYRPYSEGNESLFAELSLLYTSTKAELAPTDIESLRQEGEEIDNLLINIFHELEDISKKLQELEKQAIMSAKIVGTTLAKSYLSDTLRERKFDTVILDEASMASIPALWCASYLSASSIVIVGDFLQLPPIVLANTPMAQKWLGKDIFFHSGMQERAKSKSNCPKNFVMLNDQFRMEPEIADIANMYYGAYGGLISKDIDRGKEREAFYEWYSGKRTKHSIHLVDTESLHAWVTGVPQGKGHSRLNCFSAAVDVELAFSFLENKLNAIDKKTAEPTDKASVLIVAPYKPHIARINQLIELEYRNRGFKDDLNYIRAGTIHSFQGSEADIVIFDLVVDEPHWKTNLFLQKQEVNDELRKMFNVAITRAKFKLFVVGNFAYCQKKAKNNALSELLDILIKTKHLPKTDAKSILPEISFSKPMVINADQMLTAKNIVLREESFNEYFIKDILSFRRRLIIFSPFITEARLSVLLPAFVDAINSGKKIIVVTKALSDRGKAELRQYQKCEKELQDIGVCIFHKKGMHEKLIFIDSEAVWIGSLNVLSFTGLTGEVMQRHADRKLTAEYEKLFDIEHIYEAFENPYEQKCPICGGEMLIKESSDGGIYWQCLEEDYSRSTSQQYPIDGIIRCKCGAPFKFSITKEPRWICTENPRHYQKMREGDLKLEKMAGLIPKKDRKQVNQYFAQKHKEQENKKKTNEKTKGTEQLSMFDDIDRT